MILYHTTDRAGEIAAAGFVDGRDGYLTSNVYEGVWFADTPLHASDGVMGEQVLVLDIPDEVAGAHEWVEDEKPHREFLIPADIVNTYDVVRVVDLWELLEELPAPTQRVPVTENVSRGAAPGSYRIVTDQKEDQ